MKNDKFGLFTPDSGVQNPDVMIWLELLQLDKTCSSYGNKDRERIYSLKTPLVGRCCYEIEPGRRDSSMVAVIKKLQRKRFLGPNRFLELPCTRL